MSDLQRYLVDEMVEEYREGRLSRREALRRVALISGSLTLGATLIGQVLPAAAAPLARPTPQGGPMTSPTDPDLEVGMVQYPGDGATLTGYLARPRAEGTRAAVLLMHENRGLTEHNQDVARRLAKAGYAALAVDLLSRQGGTASFSDQAQASAALGQASPVQNTDDLRAGVAYLQAQPYVRATSVGATGQCFGGGMIWRLATAEPTLAAAVPFYGPNPPLDAVPNIQAPVLGIYAGNDERINAGIPDLEAALIAAGKTFEMVIYPGVNHGFLNDTGAVYNAEAAGAAWTKTLEWFGRYLAPRT